MIRQSSPDRYQKPSQTFDRVRGLTSQAPRNNIVTPSFNDFKFDQSIHKLQDKDNVDEPSSGPPLHTIQVKSGEPVKSWLAQPTKTETNMTESNLYAMFHEVQDALMGLCHSVEGLGNDVHSLQDEVGEVHDALDYVSNRFSEVTEDEQDAAKLQQPTLVQADAVDKQPNGNSQLNSSPEAYNFSAPQYPQTANGPADHENTFYTQNTSLCPLNAIGVDTRSLANTGLPCPFGYASSAQSPMGYQVQPAFNFDYTPTSSASNSPVFWNTVQSQSQSQSQFWTASQCTSYLASGANLGTVQTFQTQTQAALATVPSWSSTARVPGPTYGPAPTTITARKSAHSHTNAGTGIAKSNPHARAPSRRGSGAPAQCTSTTTSSQQQMQMQLQPLKRAKTSPYEQSQLLTSQLRPSQSQSQPRTISPERWHKSRRMGGGGMAYAGEFAGRNDWNGASC